MKLLHKFWNDYTEKEHLKIKHECCIGCEHFVGPNRDYTIDETKLNKNGLAIGNCTCEYLGHIGELRHCRPEICPYNSLNDKGLKLKDGEKYVRFDDHVYGCYNCVHQYEDENENPCKSCLKVLKRQGTDVPINYERRHKIYE